MNIDDGPLHTRNTTSTKALDAISSLHDALLLLLLPRLAMPKHDAHPRRRMMLLSEPRSSLDVCTCKVLAFADPRLVHYELLDVQSFLGGVIAGKSECSLDALRSSFRTELHLQDSQINRLVRNLAGEQLQLPRTDLERRSAVLVLIRALAPAPSFPRSANLALKALSLRILRPRAHDPCLRFCILEKRFAVRTDCAERCISLSICVELACFFRQQAAALTLVLALSAPSEEYLRDGPAEPAGYRILPACRTEGGCGEAVSRRRDE